MNNSPLPKDEREKREIAFILDLLKKEKNQIEAPREILQKILKNHTFSQEVSGRSSWIDNFKQIINNLKSMNQKLKVSLSILGVFVVLAVFLFAYDQKPQVAVQKESAVPKTKLATTTPVIGDEKIDASINSSLDEVLNENDFDLELDDVELALSDESSLDDINNLINDDEL